MKFALVLALSGLTPILAAQTTLGKELGAVKNVPDPVLFQPTVTAVSPTFAYDPEEILIQGSSLGASTQVWIDGFPAAILERTNSYLRVGLLPGHPPGYWPVEVSSPAGKAFGQAELWPTIQITPMDGFHDPLTGYRPAENVWSVNVHNGTAGVFILAGSIGEQTPMVLPGVGFGLCLQEPIHVMAVSPIGPSGNLRQQLRLPVHLAGGTLYLQGWASQFRPLGSECCFTNMELMAF